MPRTLLEVCLLTCLDPTIARSTSEILEPLAQLLGETSTRQVVSPILQRLVTEDLANMSLARSAGRPAQVFTRTEAGQSAIGDFMKIVNRILAQQVSGPKTFVPSPPPSSPNPRAPILAAPTSAPSAIVSMATKLAEASIDRGDTSKPKPVSGSYVIPPPSEHPFESYVVFTADESLHLTLRAQVTLDAELQENIEMILSECARRIPPYNDATYDAETFEALGLDIQDAIDGTREAVAARSDDHEPPVFQFSLWSNPVTKTFTALVGTLTFQNTYAKLLFDEYHAKSFKPL